MMERGLSDRLLAAVQQLEGGTATSMPYSTNIGRGSYSPTVSADEGSFIREAVAPTYEFTGDVANALMRLANAPGAAFRTATNLARGEENPFAPFRELMPEGFSGRPAVNQYAAIAQEEANLPGSVSEIVGLIVEAGLDPSIAGEVALAKSVPSALATLATLAPSAIERISKVYRLRRLSDAQLISPETANSLAELLYASGTELGLSSHQTRNFVNRIIRSGDLTDQSLSLSVLDNVRQEIDRGLPGFGTPTPFKTMSSNLAGLLDGVQQSVLQFYTYKGDNFMNRLLRGMPWDRTIDDAFSVSVGGQVNLDSSLRGATDYESTVNAINELDRIFAMPEVRIPESTLVYRAEVVSDPTRLPQNLNDLVGTEISYDNFISTGENLGTPSKFLRDEYDRYTSEPRDRIMWVLNLPEQTPAIGMTEMSTFPGENEVLLPRGSTFRITNVEEYDPQVQIAQRTGLSDIVYEPSSFWGANDNNRFWKSPRHLIITADVITPSAPDPIPGSVPMVPGGTP